MHFFRLAFPPYLPIICPRLICIFSDIYLVGYAMSSLGSLEIGYIMLLGEPGISSCGWKLWCFSCYCTIFFVSSFRCSVFFLIFYFALSMPVIILKSSDSIQLHVHSTSCRYMVFLHLFCLCFSLSSSQYVLASYVSVVCLCRRYVILSLGSLQKGCKKLLCQPRIFRAAGDLYASLAIALHFLSAHFTFLYSV